MPEFPTTMQAARIREYGGPEVIHFEEVPIPTPGPGEMLVKVKAASVGPWDGWIRAGHSVLPQPLPLTLGSDLSGVVEALGPEVATFAQGDEIFGVTNPRFVGAYAEHAIVSTGMAAKKPSRLDFVEAASVPVVAVTAWQAVHSQADVKAGQTLLIHGGAGNVGAYAVQLGKRAGANVIATASAEDIDFVRGLGADIVVDYRAARFEDAAKDIDVVVDCVGGDAQTRSFALLKRGGVLISAVSEPPQALAVEHGVRAHFFLVAVNTADLTRISSMFDREMLVLNIGAVLPLADAQTAHEMLEGVRRRPRGKIVLKVAD
jgi:NADPH:quinone reductase-like Zn-dependent oxidoreductase